MRILILHMRFHPDLTGTGPLVTEMATSFAAMGDEVTVVTSMPHYGRGEIPTDYRGRLLYRERLEGVNVLRTFVYVPPNPSGFHRGINFLSYSFLSIMAAALADPPDVILCVNPPITVGLSGWLVKLARRAPMVFNVQDIWPECIVIVDQLRNPFLIHVFEYMERLIYRVSSRVTVLSEGMKQNLLKKGVPDNKVIVIPNWADVDQIRPVSRNNGFRAAHNLDGWFVILFAGNIGYNSVLETVLDAAEMLQDEARFLFLIVGEGNAKRALVERVNGSGISNVRFLTTQTKERLPEMLGAADLSLVTLHRSLGQLNVPSKTYSIMASVRPVLASVPEDSEIAALVDKANCGMCIPPQDAKSLAKAIRSLSNEPELLDRYGANGRRYVLRNYDKRTLIQRHHQLLQEVARENA